MPRSALQVSTPTTGGEAKSSAGMKHPAPGPHPECCMLLGRKVNPTLSEKVPVGTSKNLLLSSIHVTQQAPSENSQTRELKAMGAKCGEKRYTV